MRPGPLSGTLPDHAKLSPSADEDLPALSQVRNRRGTLYLCTGVLVFDSDTAPPASPAAAAALPFPGGDETASRLLICYADVTHIKLSSESSVLGGTAHWVVVQYMAGPPHPYPAPMGPRHGAQAPAGVAQGSGSGGAVASVCLGGGDASLAQEIMSELARLMAAHA
jgi:hypothetical protein